MTIFQINPFLSRPLKFFELQFIENYINNPKEINKDYFNILNHLVFKFPDLTVQDLERLIRFLVLGEIDSSMSEMDIDVQSLKRNSIRNIPKYPVFINNNLKTLLQTDKTLIEAEAIFQLDQSILSFIIQSEFELESAITSLNKLAISS